MDDAAADAARSLREEARETNERRALVLTGPADATRTAAATAIDAADVPREETTLLGPASALDCERLAQRQAGDLLGRTRTAVVLDVHETLQPNALGRAVGAVDGGGLLLIVGPPLEEWEDDRGDFAASLAVPPFEVDAVTGHFRARVVDLLRAHRGIGVVDCANGTVVDDGLTDPPPRLPATEPILPDEGDFPDAAYRACRTRDQVDAVASLEALAEPTAAVVVEADRGRGKSSAAGLAAGSLALDGHDVLVTAPQYASAAEVFARARELLDGGDALASVDRADAPHRLDAGDGRVYFRPPVEAADAVRSDDDSPDAVVVDEAAALPVSVLEAFLDAPAVAYATTVHGYEGAGRGFAVRFRERLDDSDREVVEAAMDEPIRYAAGDPIEVWAFRTLLLDARPAATPLVEDATPESVTYARPSATALATDDHYLRQAFGLLVEAHYRTEPNDLARLLDAPNVTVRALLEDGRVAAVALLAREGGLPSDLRADMYEGARVRGNMLPDVLTTQLRDEAAGEAVGWRVLRIATHHAVRSRGLGSRLLGAVRNEARERDLDWLGVGYGATPRLVRFWRDNDYRAVHLSTTRNDVSGEHSAMMLQPLTDAGQRLHDRHARWFLGRVASMLSDPLATLEADVVRETLRAVAPPTDRALALDCSAFEWRLLAGSVGGAGMYDTAPEPFRRLALRHLVAPDDPDALTDREERLLVQKTLQGREWDAVADGLDYLNTAACMRALGEAVEPLLELYGDDDVMTELERFR